VNVVLLSPHFPSNFWNFAVALRRAGVNALAIADAPYDGLRPELRDALSEYFRVDDMNSYDQLLRAVAYLTYRHGKIDRFESHNEYWLATDARIRTDFNIPGITEDEIADMKYKSLMKAKFIEAGVPVARGRVVRSRDDAHALIAETGYPVVAKPDSGVGAAHTYRINDDDQLTHFFESKPPVDYIVEEFIRGDIHSFDGLAGATGEPVFFTSHIFSRGIMETINEDQDLYYYSAREIPADLEDAGRRVLRAFGVHERFFHLEFFRTRPDGQIVALEVNMRPPGGLSMDMFNYANDADLYQAWADLLAGRRVRTDYTRPYCCGYFGRKAHKQYLHSHDEIVRQLAGLLVHHERMNPLFGPVLGDEGYIVRSPDQEEVYNALCWGLETA
jgi:biotin carboxylase